MESVSESSETIIRAVSHKRKPGAPGRNLNAVRSLLYCQNPEERIDKRTTLGFGLQFHRRRVLALFDCAFDDLNAVEAERVRRLVWLTTVRELASCRLQVAIAAGDADAFSEDERRFLAVAIAEERAERLVVESANARSAANKTKSIQERIASHRSFVPTPRMPDAGRPLRVEPSPVPELVTPHLPHPSEFVDAPPPATAGANMFANESADLPKRNDRPVESTPVISDWACRYCGTKVFQVVEPEHCLRCKRSRFKTLLDGVV